MPPRPALLMRPRQALQPRRWWAGLFALVLWLAALITPVGLVVSHGAAALADTHHGLLWDDHGHRHSHGDEGIAANANTPSPDGHHAHHAADHSHDHAHALPLALPACGPLAAAWHADPAATRPAPAPSGLERPPRA